jgi:molybdate transport system regulatory protein
MKISGTLSIERGGELLGGRRIELLANLQEYGSISRAARASGISYRTAWAEIDAMNNLAPVPLVERVAGGTGGGGTWLTAAGREMLEKVRVMQREYARMVAMINDAFADQGETYTLLRRINMKLSARNQWHGQVVKLTPGAVNTVIEMNLRGGDKLTAVITRESAEALELAVGSEVMALVKASSVIIATDLGAAQLSARNQLAGTIARLHEGPVSCDVTIELAGGSLVSATVTSAAAAELGLKVGMPAWAIIKASSIILGAV